MLFDALWMALGAVTGVTIVLVAGGGALIALWLIVNRDTEPKEPYTVAVPGLASTAEGPRHGGQQIAGVWRAKTASAKAAYVEDELPF
jgi:hypothetical protein